MSSGAPATPPTAEEREAVERIDRADWMNGNAVEAAILRELRAAVARERGAWIHAITEELHAAHYKGRVGEVLERVLEAMEDRARGSSGAAQGVANAERAVLDAVEAWASHGAEESKHRTKLQPILVAHEALKSARGPR